MMSRFRRVVPRLALVAALAAATSVGLAGTDLAQGFARPPASAKPWAYWWWLDSNASREGITRDLEEMQRQGIAGVLIFDAGMGGPLAPDGPVFMSEAWRELFKFAVHEAERLRLEVSINLCSGWNAGGTWVKPEHAAQKLTWSQIRVRGPAEVAQALPQPPTARLRPAALPARAGEEDRGQPGDHGAIPLGLPPDPQRLHRGPLLRPAARAVAGARHGDPPRVGRAVHAGQGMH